MSSKKCEVQEKSLGGTIRRLREKVLGSLKRYDFAQLFDRKLEVTADVIANWERNRSLPNGLQMVAILNLCHREAPQLLTEFGLDISKWGEQYPSSQVLSEGIKQETLMPPSTVADKKVEVKHAKKRRVHADEHL